MPSNTDALRKQITTVTGNAVAALEDLLTHPEYGIRLEAARILLHYDVAQIKDLETNIK